jgi:hypothetical protein
MKSKADERMQNGRMSKKVYMALNILINCLFPDAKAMIIIEKGILLMHILFRSSGYKDAASFIPYSCIFIFILSA